MMETTWSHGGVMGFGGIIAILVFIVLILLIIWLIQQILTKQKK